MQPVEIKDPIPAFLSRTRLVEPIGIRRPGELEVCGAAMLNALRTLGGSLRLFCLAGGIAIRVLAYRALHGAAKIFH